MFSEASNNSVKPLSLQLTDMPYSQAATMSATYRVFVEFQLSIECNPR